MTVQPDETTTPDEGTPERTPSPDLPDPAFPEVLPDATPEQEPDREAETPAEADG